MLTNPRAVIVTRRGENFSTAEAAADFYGWNVIGKDQEDLVLTDAGNVMVGFSFQQHYMPDMIPPTTPVGAPSGLAAGIEAAIICEVCSAEMFSEFNTSAVNAGSELELVPADFDAGVAQVAATLSSSSASIDSAIIETTEGRRLSFFDNNGNLTTLLDPAASTFNGAYGSKLNTLVQNKSQSSNVTGVTLMVSNVQASLQFYRDVLGLQPLRTTQQEVKLDAGPIILTIKAEPYVGMAQANREQKKLRDAIIFYVDDIVTESNNLHAGGVNFPIGIEDSYTGRVAYFSDPDGHNYWLWQSPRANQYPNNTRINFYPVLDRILGGKSARQRRQATT